MRLVRVKAVIYASFLRGCCRILSISEAILRNVHALSTHFLRMQSRCIADISLIFTFISRIARRTFKNAFVWENQYLFGLVCKSTRFIRDV